MTIDIDYLQLLVSEWVLKGIGEKNLFNKHERAMRILEEALELAQAEGINPGEVNRLFIHVYSRPPGLPEQEGAGLGTTLFAWATSRGLMLGDLISKELARVSQPEVAERVKRKQLEKVAAGISMGTDHE